MQKFGLNLKYAECNQRVYRETQDIPAYSTFRGCIFHGFYDREMSSASAYNREIHRFTPFSQAYQCLLQRL